MPSVPSETPRLALPLIAAAQAQKHVTHNEALALLDSLVHLSVLSRVVAVPPAAPGEGDRYIVAAGASGVWAGKAGRVAVFDGTGWSFLAPQAGWVAWVAAERLLVAFDGTAWGEVEAGRASRFGVNATPDATNRLAVASAGSLFTHDGAGHRMTINRKTTADTASQIFSTGYSARAEVGLTGGDALEIKVSGDGTTFRTALVAESSGLVRRPRNPCGAQAMTGGLSAAVGPSAWVTVTSALTTWSTVLSQEVAFDPATGRFTAPAAGAYRFEASVTFYSVTAGVGVYLSLWRNGGVVPGSQRGLTIAAAAGFGAVQTHALLSLDAGDVVDLRVFASGANVQLLNGGFGSFSVAFAG